MMVIVLSGTFDTHCYDSENKGRLYIVAAAIIVAGGEIIIVCCCYYSYFGVLNNV